MGVNEYLIEKLSPFNSSENTIQMYQTDRVRAEVNDQFIPAAFIPAAGVCVLQADKSKSALDRL